MHEIYREKKTCLDAGDGFFATIIEKTSIDGLVLKVFITYGTNEEEVLLTSLLSKSKDKSYLYSEAYRLLNNKKHCRRVWEKHMNKMKQDE